MTEKVIEFELAEDVQEFIVTNPDVDYVDSALKKKIEDANVSDLLKVVKTIESPTTFISVDIVDEKFAEKEL